MEQVIIGGVYDLLDINNTEYTALVGGALQWTVTESEVYKIISADGLIKNLRVKLSGAPGGTDKYEFTLMVNGAPSALTFEIIGAATTGSNMVNEIDVVPGDWVSLRCVPTDTPAAVYATWTCMFEGDTANESLILGGSRYTLSSAATEYGQVMCGFTNYGVVEDNYREVVPTAGVIKDFYVKLNLDPGDIGVDGYTFTVRLNGATVAQSLIVTIMADNTTGNDLAHNLVVAAGDILTMMIVPVGAPAVTPTAGWGMTFVATVDGESIILGGTLNVLDNAVTEYARLVYAESNHLWINDETQRYQLGQICTLKKLYMLLSAPPGAGNTYTFTIRIAGANSNVVAAVTGAAVTGNSGALEDTVANDEYLDLQVVPDDTPDVATAFWGFVSLLEVGWSGKISGVVNPAEIAGVAVADIAEVKGVA